MGKKLYIMMCLVPLSGGTLLHAQEDRTSHIVDNAIVSAVAAYTNGEIKTAYTQLRQAEMLSPENDAVHYYLGNVLSVAGQMPEALKHYSKAYTLDSANVWYAAQYGAALNSAGRPAEAIGILEPLLKVKNSDAELTASCMDSYLMLGESEKADSMLVRLEAIGGESDYTRLTRLELLRMQGRFADFFDSLKSFFKETSMPASKKVDIVRKVLHSSDPRFNFAHLDDYLEITGICLDMHPSDTAVTHFAVGMYMSADRKEKVLELCERNQDDPYMLEVGMVLNSGEGNYKAALQDADKLLALSGDDTRRKASLHAAKGDFYQMTGHAEKSFREYEQALKYEPDNVAVLNNYAYFMACEGKNLAKCARMSRKAVEAEPENPTYIDTYAWILYKQKKYVLAKAYFKKAMLYGGKDNAEILSHYAETLEALGENILARAYREKAALKKDAGKK